MQNCLSIEAISVIAPGITDWKSAFAGGNYSLPTSEMEIPAPSFLHPRERRRMSASANLALCAAEQVLEGRTCDIPAVFASSAGESLILHRILESLNTPERLVSPTQFHNSVHNSPAGYWSIGKEVHASTMSIAAWDGTVAAGLLKASAQALVEDTPVLLVLYDTPCPEPLHAKRVIDFPMAVAMVIAPGGQVSVRSVSSQEPITVPTTPAGKALWKGNPIGRITPLLEAMLAPGGEVNLEGNGSSGVGVVIT
jgi:hypothetical protein